MAPVGTSSLVIACLAFAAGLCASCTRRPPPDQLVENGWEVVRAALTNGEACFAGRADYCLSDPSFVDAAIQPRLDELYGGEMPLRRAFVEATARAATLRYKRAMIRPENLEKIEQLVTDRYLNPQVTESGDRVTVDLGVVPGKLVGSEYSLTISMASSDLVVAGEWAEDELRRTLASYAARFPEKRVVRLVVWVPWAGDRASSTRSASNFGAYSVRYFRDSGLVVEKNPNGELRTSKRNLDLTSDKGGPSLRFVDLSPCKPSETPGPKDVDPPRVCPPDS